MILINKKFNREIDVEFDFFRDEYEIEIKEAFNLFREFKLLNYPENFRDDFSMEYNFYFEFQKNFNQFSENYEVRFE